MTTRIKITENADARNSRLMKVRGENVPTSALREGDILRLHGCLLRLGEIKESQAHKDEGYGACLYSTAEVLYQYDETIPRSWLGSGRDKVPTWQVQGNDLASWNVVQRATN